MYPKVNWEKQVIFIVRPSCKFIATILCNVDHNLKVFPWLQNAVLLRFSLVIAEILLLCILFRVKNICDFYSRINVEVHTTCFCLAPQVMVVIKYLFQFGFFPWNSPHVALLYEDKPFFPPRILGLEKMESYVKYDLIQLLALLFHQSLLKVSHY